MKQMLELTGPSDQHGVSQGDVKIILPLFLPDLPELEPCTVIADTYLRRLIIVFVRFLLHCSEEPNLIGNV